jgi:hypothetical protein
MPYVNIDGEVVEVHIHDYGYPMITDGDRGWYVFQDSEAAGREADKYWRDMAENDSDEFIAIVGTETLVRWCLHQPAGPGNTTVNSLEEWFNIIEMFPEETWASYDGIELEGSVSKEVQSILGFDSKEVVFYRHN